jgi:class 3 adenylate cyclase
VKAAFVDRVRRAVALDAVGDDVRRFSDQDVEAMKGLRLVADVFGEEAALEFARVLGGALGRVAEGAVTLYLDRVEDPRKRAGTTELELARANRDATAALRVAPAVMETLFRRHLEETVRRAALVREGDRSAVTVRMAVGFVDLVGFTAHTRTLSAPALAVLVRGFAARAHELVGAYGGRVVKLIGDEVMFVALDADAAPAIALALVDAFRNDASAVVPRAGVALGSLLMVGGDYYGTTVNLAARVADAAVPLEVLATEEVATHAVGHRFTPAGRRALKGFPEPVPLFSAARR